MTQYVTHVILAVSDNMHVLCKNKNTGHPVAK